MRKMIWVYGAGKLVQLFPGMPQFLRFYLADLVFVPAVGFGLVYFDLRRMAKKGINTYTKKQMLVLAWIALSIALLSEDAQWMVGHGDIYDAVCYFIGFMMCYVCYKLDPNSQWLITEPEVKKEELSIPVQTVAKLAVKRRKAQKGPNGKRKNR